LMALFFPLLILAAGYYYDVALQDSFSAYYFGLPAADLQVNPKVFPGIFPTRVFFSGTLCALGVFMILYKGFNLVEDILLWFAGAAAIFVAIFPMWYNKLYPETGFAYQARFERYSIIHYRAALVLFGCMVLVSWICAKTTLDDPQLSLPSSKAAWSDQHPRLASFFIAYFAPIALPTLWGIGALPTHKETFRRNYNWIGLAMVLFPSVATVLMWMLEWRTRWILLAEALGVWTFAAFWLVKSRELSLSQPERTAIENTMRASGGATTANAAAKHPESRSE